MPGYSTADIRNIALIGHSSAGKTSLAEAVLHATGVTNRLGSVADGTSVLDYTDEEKERGGSILPSLCHVSAEGKTINIIDTPGSPDFVGPAMACLAAVETGVCVISASAGIEVNTRRMMNKAAEYGLARMVVINKIDAENVDLSRLVSDVREVFGNECVCVNLPAPGGRGVVDCLGGSGGEAAFGSVEDWHTACVEAIVETDEALMEEYLDAGSIAPEKLREAVFRAVATGRLVPIVFTSATSEIGIQEFLRIVASCLPSPVEGKRRKLLRGDSEEEIEPRPDGPLRGLVFRVATDPRSNIKYSFVRVFSGTMRPDSSVYPGDERKAVRPGQLHKFIGAEHSEIDAGVAGDIVAVAKLDLTVGTVLHDGDGGQIEMPRFPTPMFALAIEPKSRGDTDKISAALHRFSEEDPCFVSERDPATGELVVRGMGDQHLRSVLDRMKRYMKLEVETRRPKIPYRETITGVAKNVEYTHKKQTGGAGQYARVVINIEPNERGKGYEFIDQIFGGAIDQAFRPSVDKGIRAQMAEGVLAGYPVVDVKVYLVDGKTHPVDSKDIAFQIAGREAFKIAFEKAKPCILEPIVTLEVTAPTEFVGDLTGDIASRRGRPIGQESLPGGLTLIRAEIPLAEVADYSSRLSSITGGQGSYTLEFSHYEPVPANIQQQIIEEARKAREAAAAAH